MPLADAAAAACSCRPRRGRATDIKYRPRRQLVCADRRRRRATRSSCCASSSSIRASRSRCARATACASSARCAPGFFGVEMVHPQLQVVAEGAPLPDPLTPVYPTTAGLRQGTLRGVIERALAADPSLTAETLPEASAPPPAGRFRDACAPARAAAAPDARRSAPRRAHAPGVAAPQVRRAPRAAALDAIASRARARRASRAGAAGTARSPTRW